MIQKVNLSQKFSLFNDHWSPKLAGRVDHYAVKLVKVQGEFVWHHHDDEDELFLVTKGQLTIEVKDQPDIVLDAGEFVVIPKGVEHRPVAAEEVELLLFEREAIINTGNVESEHTVKKLDEI